MRENEEEIQYPAKRLKQETVEAARSPTIKRENIDDEEEEVVFLSAKVIRKITAAATAPAMKAEIPAEE